MTKRSLWLKSISLLLVCSLLLGMTIAYAHPEQSSHDLPVSQTAFQPPRPRVSAAAQQDVSPPLRDLAVSEVHDLAIHQGAMDAPAYGSPPKVSARGSEMALDVDNALQSAAALGPMPDLLFNFDGVNNRDGILPPDTNGDIGLNHYFQWVNLSLTIWQIDRATKTLTVELGPVAGNIFWSGFSGACAQTNDGDPIVLYDHLADRWLVTQFSLPNYPYGPFYECVAVSQTSDPTGAWYRYAYRWVDANGNDIMNDYPKFGVWPDGYYMTANQFASSSGSWRGVGVAALERDKMLLGQPARMIYFDMYPVDPNFGNMLPADLDGPPPPSGAPAYFAEVDDRSWLGSVDALRIWEFDANWLNPDLSTFGNAGEPHQTIAVEPFNPLVEDFPPCTPGDSTYCIPQPGSAPKLDGIGDRLMHRLQYRNFGSYQTLVANHTVGNLPTAASRASLRWYELRKTTGNWQINQQGTYAGDGTDSEHRWMGSIAMDRAGNIALGYSVSSSSTYPSIRYTGRLTSDPANTMARSEKSLMAGTGAQTHKPARWGDYSQMSVDPVDDCTFWYTNEYIQSSSDANWRTRIGSFTFPSCEAEPYGNISGVVLDSNTGLPLQDVTIQANSYTTQSDALGNYHFFDLPSGTYTATASLYGYTKETATFITLEPATTSIQNFSLTPLSPVTVSGVVQDASGKDWPLYARLDISAEGFAKTLYTDAVSGAYTITVPENTPHSFVASAFSGGYHNQTQAITASVNTTLNFTLTVDAADCTAPGYDPANSCLPNPGGGLLVGNVFDDNTGDALNGASVQREGAPTETANSNPTPDDPNIADGFYILYSSTDSQQSFTASKALYGPKIQSANIVSGSITSADFYLPAGQLTVDPTGVSAKLKLGKTTSRRVVLHNSGALAATINVYEASGAAPSLNPGGPFATSVRRLSPKQLGGLTAEKVYQYIPPSTGLLPGGTVLKNWSAGETKPWGISLDPASGDMWISENTAGASSLQRILPNGALSGDKVVLPSAQVYAAADLAYNSFSGNLWLAKIGSDNCIMEFDPQEQSMTGLTICPPFAHSKRGLAFDPVDGTYYAGSWTDGLLYHFNSAGVVLDSVDLNLNIAGLALNPTTRHLFVLSNANLGYDIYIIDLKSDRRYPILGGFDIAGMPDYQQAGLEMDCDGNLWAVSQEGSLFQVESGETGACAWDEVSWLQVSPIQGTVLPGGSLPLTLTITTNGAALGSNQAHITIASQTPYGELNVAVEMEIPRIYLPVMFFHPSSQ